MTDQKKLSVVMEVFGVEITKETLRSFSTAGRKFCFNPNGDLIRIVEDDGKVYKIIKLEVE